nr:sporulation integral membrane protein YlbJ [Paenibacillus antibioticophila]
MKTKPWHAPLLGGTALILASLMIAYPNASWDASVRGLAIWWDVLFPSLFPFFVISEVLLGFGIVHFLGKLLDPLMKPLFRIPGNGGFVLAMGFASGYPVSAKLATKLREQGLISRIEGERLVAFTTTSDPIFLIGAVSIGFFGNPQLAGALAAVHYGSAIMLGLLLRFYGTRQELAHKASANTPAALTSSASGFSLRLAVRAMHEARLQDGRSLGELLRHAVVSSLQLMTIVGGLVVFFSVVLEVLTASQVMNTLYDALRMLLPLLSLPDGLAEPLVGGLFEVTLGSKASAISTEIPLHFKAASAAFILSWGGLSVHAQVASILNGADLRYLPFLAARAIHGVLSAALLLIFWKPLMATDSVFSRLDSSLPGTVPPWELAVELLRLASTVVAGMLVLSFIISFASKMNRK